MYAMGRLGSYISGSLYTASGPFHVFGGAVDVVVVEQPDGSFKSSPWYVRFGKFQGVLKAKEKVVNISVNGVDTNFQMYLDERGQAYFLKEVEGELEDSPSYPSSSSDEMVGQSQKNMRQMRPKSYTYYANKSNLGDQIDANNGKAVARTNSRRSRILGLVFGQGSMRREHYQEGGDDKAMVRISSWDRAEIAANLLEMQWSTNRATSKCRKDDAVLFSVSDTSDVKGVDDMLNNDEKDQNRSSLSDIIESSLDYPMLSEPTGSCNLKVETAFPSSFEGLECSIVESSICMRSLSTEENIVEDSIIGESVLEEKCEMISELPRNIDEPMLCSPIRNDNTEGVISLVVIPDSQTPQLPEACSNERSDKEKASEQGEVALASFDRCGEESGSVRAEAFMLCKMSETSTMGTKVKGVAMAENICTIESFSKSDHGSQNEKCESVGDFVQFYGNGGLKKAFSTHEFERPEDEHFLFSGVDEYKLRETWCGSNLSVGEDNENHSSFCLQGVGDGSSPANKEACSSTDQSVKEDQLDNLDNLTGNFDALSKPIGIPKACGISCAEVEQPTKSLPIMWSCMEGLDRVKLHHPLSHSLDSNSKSQDWTSDRRGKHCNIVLDADNENQSSQECSDEQDTHVLCRQNGAGTPVMTSIAGKRKGEPTKEVVDSDGNWRFRPFSLKKSRSRKTMQPLLHDSEISNSETALDININEESDSNVPKFKGRRKMVKANTPTSEQLALLNLKEGSNIITFTFSTAMLGLQKVDARIYLWKWNTRIVISDVDGTITKSDVLGQFMPLVGVDWSQTGVAHLFSAIKDNGYKLLFLSARAISQAYLTRQFLLNLEQDGKALPDGPAVISPDGLFPSLFHEVIRKTPHEFKIACLEDIRALFPHDYNPFYAGFGNRDTDESSYLKVGIPRGKIFIINPKGEVAVNRCVDTKSYISLHALVEDMFPPAASSEQEDFNTWNYWKLPPPVIDN